jgi:hypothetical protein
MESGFKYGGKYCCKQKNRLHHPLRDAILHDLLIHSSMTPGHKRTHDLKISEAQ